MRTNILDYLDQGGLRVEPDSIWVKDADVAWTFGEFNDRACSIGSALILNGVTVGDVVAVFMPNSAHVLAADFGVSRSGAAYMNIDIGLPALRVMAILDSVRPKIVLVSRALHHQIPPRFLDSTLVYEDLLDAQPDLQAIKRRRDEVIDTDPACLITTSGSTGVPKAVALSHRGLVDFIEWFDYQFDFRATDVVGSLSPLFFDGYIPGLFMSLLHGGKFVILPREAAAFPVKLAEQLATNGITFIFWVPSTLVPIAKLRVLDNLALPLLRFVGFAGEVMQPSALSYLRKALPKARFVNFYGPIEISVICSYFVVPDDYPEDLAIPIGHACANTRISILNDHGRHCAPGEVGELCVSGSCVALGYWNEPEKTSEAFVRNPLVHSHSEMMYRTGDLVSAEPNGPIQFVGRKDFQIKHQGYRIELGEIEHAADVGLPVDSCCVVYDKGSRNIVLFYDAVNELTAQDVRRRLSEILPKYMLPTKIVRLSSMPLNSNGKIDRKLLESNVSNY